LIRCGEPLNFDDTLRSSIIKIASTCSYCGFCEWVCPTLQVMRLRIFGPRGRVTVASVVLREGIISRAGYEAIFTCLLCGACNTQCPAGVDVVEVVKNIRSYLLSLKR